MPSLIFWLPQTKIKYAATEKICFDIILETNFHEAKAVPVHENLRTHIQRCRVPRQGERGGKGFAGKTKKSRLAEWRALVNFLVVPAIWRRGRDSNPRWLLTTHAFQACTFDRSDTSAYSSKRERSNVIRGVPENIYIFGVWPL